MKVFSKFHGTFASQEKKYYASLVGVLGTFGFSTKPNPKDRRFKNGVNRRTRSSERVEYWSNICYDSVLELVSQLCYFKFKTFSHFSDNYSVADVLKISNYEENLWMFMTISQDLVFSTYYFETDNL